MDNKASASDNLAHLEGRMRELLQESEMLQKQLSELRPNVTGVIDDTRLIAAAERVESRPAVEARDPWAVAGNSPMLRNRAKPKPGSLM
jgi:hypothetical protein